MIVIGQLNGRQEDRKSDLEEVKAKGSFILVAEIAKSRRSSLTRSVSVEFTQPQEAIW